MRKFSFALLPVLALAVVGCGGGGSSTPGGGSGTMSRVAVFVADNMGDYDHVYVTIKRIELVGPSGNVTVYENAEGKEVDLAALTQNGESLFSFLGYGSIPSGTYRRAKITLDDDLTIFAAGATTGQARTFQGAGNGEKMINIDIAGEGEVIAGDDTLVFDFDLSKWQDNGSQIVAVAGMHDRRGFDDDNKHVSDDFHGTVSNLTTTSFVLNTGRFGAINVSYNAQTDIYGDLTTLANGQKVEVDGVYDPATKLLTATSIKIETEDDDDLNQDEAKGAVVTEYDNGFDLDLREVEDFVPASDPIRVVYGENVRFRGDRNVTYTEDQFEALIQSGSAVKVEGAYDSATNTLTATQVKLDSRNDD